MERRTAMRALAMAALVAGGGACGSLVDSSYEGDLLFSVSGVVQRGSLAAVDGPVRVAVLWANGRVDEYPPTPDSSYVATEAATDGDFPAGFALEFTQEPIAEIMYRGTGSDAYALGFVVAYLDCNGNGRFDRSEYGPPDIPTSCAGLADDDTDLIVGLERNHAILFVSTDVAPGSLWGEMFRTSATIPEGYATVDTRARISSCSTNEYYEVVSCKCQIEGHQTFTCSDQVECYELQQDANACGAWNFGQCAPNDVGGSTCVYADWAVVATREVATMSMDLVDPNAIGHGTSTRPCDGNGDCVDGWSCLVSSVCIADASLSSGETCDQDRQCSSGSCGTEPWVCD